jgi:hypothetical protein
MAASKHGLSMMRSRSTKRPSLIESHERYPSMFWWLGKHSRQDWL